MMMMMITAAAAAATTTTTTTTSSSTIKTTTTKITTTRNTVGAEIAAHNAGVGRPTVCPIGSAFGSDAESYNTSHC